MTLNVRGCFGSMGEDSLALYAQGLIYMLMPLILESRVYNIF